jgi:UDP-N-acetylmuramate--alanine ligase
VVCLNVDYDHVEYYKNKKQYKESLIKFFNQAKEKVIINSSISYKKKNQISFGCNNSSIKAKNIRYTEKGICFNLYVNKEHLKDVFLPFYGKHMLMNSLACIACCSYLNLPIATIVESLKKYKDAGRRYNISFNKSNVIIDDYGHHPTEIKSTISAIKQEFDDKNIVVIYHPDRPKRLTTFLNDYKKVFNSVEKVYILPFISDSEEGKNAIDLIVDGNKINKFTDSFYKEYNNTVFLFTGSKEMGNIIKKLNNYL